MKALTWLGMAMNAWSTMYGPIWWLRPINLACFAYCALVIWKWSRDIRYRSWLAKQPKMVSIPYRNPDTGNEVRS